MADSDSIQASSEAELNDAAHISAEQWNEDAIELLGEVTRSQKEIEDMLKKHQQDASELCTLKAAAEEELQQLQVDAWKLEMYAQLERMAQQLEMLVPIEASQDQGAHDQSCGAARKEDVPCDGGSVHGDDGTELESLAALDQEIEELNGRLADARAEVMTILSSKADLQQELHDLLQQQQVLEQAAADSPDYGVTH